MTMTPTEERALALVNEVFSERCLALDSYINRSSNSYHEAICRELETTEARHAAEMQELKERFSEALMAIRRKTVPQRCHDAFDELAAPFIIPAPDPLVEADKMVATLQSEAKEGSATAQRAASIMATLIAALRAQEKDTNA